MFVGGVMVGAGMMAQPVVAQEATQEAKPQRVEITGSRIPTLNLEGASPITVLGSKDIKIDGVRDVESLLNNLPQVFASQSGNVANGASGTATVDLRGLGSGRTLVLVNGHRLPQGSPGTTAADLNQIPAGLIKRVEVLTGGAGAVYGADAVSGVVNFIMNDRFEGVQIDVNASGYTHTQQGTGGVADLVRQRGTTNPKEFKLPGNITSPDGKQKEASLLLGGNFADGKGNATMYLNYKQTDKLLQSERDFSSCSLSASAAGFACGGSGTSATGRFTAPDNKVYTVADAAGTFRPFSNATDQYNFGPTNYYQRPDERYSASSAVHYDLSEQVRLYGSFAFHSDTSDAQIAPGGIFGNVYTLRFDNPLLSASQRTAFGLLKNGDTADVVIQRRNVEGGGRDANFQNTSFRSLFGVKGEINSAWNYDIFAQTAKVDFNGSSQNYFSVQKGNKALDVVNVNGKATCRSAVDGSDPACIPYNPFVLGGVTAEQLAYIQVTGGASGYTKQQIQGGSIAGDLTSYGWKLPSAKNGVGVSFGLEHRVEQIDFRPDEASKSGDLDGSGGPSTPVAGRYSVKDIFGEVRVPLIEGQSMAQLLAVNASYRHSEIDTGVKANTFGLGLEWQPISEVRFRGSFQKAVRAANIVELFSPNGLSLYNNDADPCAGSNPTASAANCARTGVSAAQYGNIQDSPAGQYNQYTGGNPNLLPENSKSKTFGVVLTPMKNLSMSIDYFDIKVDDTINNVSAVTILNKCLNSGDAKWCALVKRDRLGTLWLLPEGRVTASTQNIGTLGTSGVDLNASYVQKLDAYGSLGISLSGTMLKSYEVEEIKGDGTYDCVGYYNNAAKCGQPRPKWRHKVRANWNTPWNVDVAMTWRYFGASDLEGTSSNPLLKNTVQPVESHFNEVNYLDLAASWNINENLTLAGGINNILDRDPPLTSKYGQGVGNGNTFPSMYDAFGRKLFINLSAKFK